MTALVSMGVSKLCCTKGKICLKGYEMKDDNPIRIEERTGHCVNMSGLSYTLIAKKKVRNEIYSSYMLYMLTLYQPYFFLRSLVSHCFHVKHLLYDQNKAYCVDLNNTHLSITYINYLLHRTPDNLVFHVKYPRFLSSW